MIIQNSAVVTASTQTDDILVNQVLAVARGYFVVDYAFTASAAGLILDLMVGLNTVAPQVVPSIQNRTPLYPDDFIGRFGVVPGDRIMLRARETAGANKTLFYAFRFNPVAMGR